ncbi:carbohydrate ABC transporter permease [Marinomonas sp. 2405UD68-3]|uniref:carbohydrate ABC transporter permease n=1 Tax=Marinomonas sp. 2405UD68-3 TaxID=3391835 RepID=UPI0039C94DAF
MGQLALALVIVIFGVLGCAAYFYGSNFLLDKFFPSKNRPYQIVARNLRITSYIRPWLFLGPALFSLGFYLVYPVVESFRLSFFGRSGEEFVGLANYAWLFNSDEFHQAFKNNMLWLVVVPTAATFFGLIIAVMTDRIWWGNIAKSLIFMPMAISFIGASVIWKFIYDFRSGGDPQIGLLNAVVVFFGGDPQQWITLDFWNNFFLMIILIWIQTGFAMVILSAALRGIPDETIEAAILDGANGFQIFYKIMVPQIWGTIAVVWTTITILVLKVFDVVLAMTNGQWGTQVLANQMFDWMFRGGGDFGRGAVVAIVIMVLVVPIMVWNIRRANAEMEGR